jgi:hypothetical protein
MHLKLESDVRQLNFRLNQIAQFYPPNSMEQIVSVWRFKRLHGLKGSCHCHGVNYDGTTNRCHDMLCAVFLTQPVTDGGRAAAFRGCVKNSEPLIL